MGDLLEELEAVREPMYERMSEEEILGELAKFEEDERQLPNVPASSAVDHPAHYGGADNPYEAIKVIEAWDLGFCLGNAVKYISRAGRKDPERTIEDLEKARWYIDRHIQRLKGELR